MAVKRSFPLYRTGIGQDSHRFLTDGSSKPCVVGGLVFDTAPGLDADSDGDVVLHSICNAISSLSGIPILGGIARDLCHKDGITDSSVYLDRALDTLLNQSIVHVALTIEGKRPPFQARANEMREVVSRLLNIEISQVGITFTSGDGLTDFGCGEGLQCLCILTSVEMPVSTS